MKPAVIVDEHDRLTDCIVVDISRTGAKLRLLPANAGFPQRFRLRLARETFEADVVWRDGLDAGVCFVTETAEAAAPLAAAAKVAPRPMSVAALRRLAPMR